MKSLSSSSHHSAKTSSCSPILCAIMSPGPRVPSPLHIFRSASLVSVGEMSSVLLFPCLPSACVLPTDRIASWKMPNFSISVVCAAGCRLLCILYCSAEILYFSDLAFNILVGCRQTHTRAYHQDINYLAVLALLMLPDNPLQKVFWPSCLHSTVKNLTSECSDKSYMAVYMYTNQAIVGYFLF
jgi:hypothetical protein